MLVKWDDPSKGASHYANVPVTALKGHHCGNDLRQADVAGCDRVRSCRNCAKMYFVRLILM